MSGTNAKTKTLAVQKSESPTPASLLQIAVQQNYDIDKLKELMDLQDRWEKKEAKKNFLAALSRFQTLVPVLKKAKIAKVQTRTGGEFSYRYADLGTITGAIKEALNECGLSYRWSFTEQNGKMRVTCFVSHLDGHTEETSMEAGADTSGAKNDIQQKGSTHTYLQRYTLIGALGLSTADEDNDGKNVERTRRSSDDHGQPDDDVIEQWKQVLAGVKNQVELNKLYVQNQRAVDGNKQLQQMFKAREAEVKPAKPVSLP